MIRRDKQRPCIYQTVNPHETQFAKAIAVYIFRRQQAFGIESCARIVGVVGKDVARGIGPL